MKEIWKSYRIQPIFKVDWNMFVCLIMAFDSCDALRIFHSFLEPGSLTWMAEEIKL